MEARNAELSDIERLLISLRIKGFGKPELLAEALGVAPDACSALTAQLKAEGLAEDTRVGVRLTPAGRAAADAILSAERGAVDEGVVGSLAERFSSVNNAFKHLITRWQMREVDGKQVRNDHSDSAYDSSVLDEFETVHSNVCGVVGDLTSLVPRFGGYQTRLGSALAKVRSGDLRYVAAPDAESYHSIWFELHQDLIGLSGTTRAKEVAAGRAV